ncbi:MAG: MATE family efflux transporter, partial [Prevotellaceae bacterium]|nr:MATE family efflux transporter [Prevotellaceae bacterium]
MNKRILLLAIPSIISNITVPLLGLVDVAITGHLGETAYIGAIAIGTLFFNIIYWNFGFLRMGTSGLAAQAFGKRDKYAQMRILTQAVIVALTIAAAILLLQYPLKKISFHFLNPAVEIANYALLYVNILIWGAPPMLLLYAFNGWFIGMQNARFQMYVAVSMNLANILLSFLFVYVFGMKIEGVAWSTLIAQYLGLCLAIVLWQKKYRSHLPYLQFKGSMRLSRMKRFFSVNRDIFLRTLCLVAVTAFFTYAGTQQGAVTLAVNTLLMQLFMLFSYFMDGFAYAGEALAGRYTGAGNLPQLKRAVKGLFKWGIGLSLFFTLLYAVGGTSFLRLLTNDRQVIEASAHYYYWAMAVPLAGFAA